MLFIENMIAALSELWVNKLRSILTTLGIIIATSSVITVVSLLDGFNRSTAGFIEGMGSDAIWISPDPTKARNRDKVELTEADAQAIADRSRAISGVAPTMQRNVRVRHGRQDMIVPMTGTTQTYQRIRNWYVDAGRYFTATDQSQRAAVCVLGRSVLESLQIDPNKIVGEKIRLGPRLFTVVGLMEKKGHFLGNDQDKVVLIPFNTAKKLYGQKAAGQLMVMAQVESSDMAGLAVEEIERVLRQRHGLKEGEENDFRIQTQDQVLEFFNKSSRLATVVLAGVVSISLVVGGIGIMNIMLVSVTERTREIGTLKALGAREKDILIQFMIEAIVLSSVGGVIGILVGAGASMGISAVSPLPPAHVPMWSIVLGFVFSLGTGLFFGIYPAIKAARLNPIEALRYE